MPSWLTSTVVHLVLLLLLATAPALQTPNYGGDQGGNIAETGTFNADGDDHEQLEESLPQNMPIAPELDAAELAAGPEASQLKSQVVDANLPSTVPDLDVALSGFGVRGDGGGAMGEMGDMFGGASAIRSDCRCRTG